ncbi:tRNA (adenosine(37)-N6)-threonylcarbamoyltransferase complex dimerization subunit type 1 TsaB [Blochmannia endosymbiont of Camponotus sp.]|uniref:tRNA (adenosine(37)-N6)-threonylcarbamoyltransferase complex dimerization subunit type 1 TsaB n=1 Tax=Blochmannia endosymbiont of Camponotus sp. TaxID=700220 RepID=UPI002024158A|nr:tRNA (adenosine(37)-N6)-threonylcarbamoyltransferase complex dimerization subunit type 1 TsaB [Blochmannia endosymbiont of Camponotus sp.]URJ23767.1 tRNA (adenosine(37)-N6)-threonylcarbamoyltransferase complex dimerization subunit type 1 TsaB [Blochmannia endosymbiont of Camponotus sp.]URJ25473.1 tRNA (adenosine(37)-N6)-threonylcarbamoyltransferase complex dimerization subunit type 1 TsaB [Blochmannia endosymbiont of Camponotus sp.]
MATRILAFDTTTELCSVAIMIDHSIYDHKIVAPRSHSENILPMVNQLLIEVGVTLQSLDCIVFNRGPGSFSGIRIGISVAQGLALGADLPLVEVSALEVLAQGAWRIFSAKQVISTIDARMGELYWACYYRISDDSCWIRSDNESIIRPEIIIKKLIYSSFQKLQGNWALVGTGWNNYPMLKSIRVPGVISLKKSIMSPEAQDMLPLGICSWKNKIFIHPNQAKPVYLRNVVAVKPDDI